MSLRESVRALFGEDDLHAGNVEAVSARIRDAIRPGYYRRIIGEVSRIRYCQVNSLEAQVFMETQDPGLVDGLMGGHADTLFDDAGRLAAWPWPKAALG